MLRLLRHRVGGLAIALGAVSVLASVRCADVNRGLGEACIRDQDCLSGACAGQQCVASPPLFDASAAFDAGSGAVGEAGGGDAALDAGSAAEASAPADAGHAATDAGDAAHAQADAAPPDSSPPDSAHGDAARDGGVSDAHPASG